MFIPRTRFSSPGPFEEFMSDFGPGLSPTPFRSSDCNASITIAALSRTVLLNVVSTNLHFIRSPGTDMSITIPLRGCLLAGTRGQKSLHRFGQDEIFVLNAEREFTHCAPDNLEVLVASIEATDMLKKIESLSGTRLNGLPEILSSTTPGGRTLKRFASYFWSEMQDPLGLRTAPLALAEMEDCLTTMIALAISDTTKDDIVRASNLKTVRLAEDYLLNHLTEPISRSELADCVGVSVRSLSRTFQQVHNLGPISWLRSQRLEAARVELIAALPGEVSVTEIANRYGFENPGRFASAYQRRFAELPSTTLKDRR